MELSERKTNIALQMANQAVDGLTNSLAKAFETEDTLRAELAALKAKYEPKEAAVPAMAEGREK